MPALTVLCVVLCGLVLGLGAGVTVGAADSDTAGDLKSWGSLSDGNETQTEIMLAESTFDDSDYDDPDIVVTFHGNVIPGEQASAEETPVEPTITADGEPVRIFSGGVAKIESDVPVTVDGDPVEISNDGTTMVTSGENGGQELFVGDDGTIQAEDENGDPVSAEADGTLVEYEHYDESEFVVEFDGTDNISEGERLSANIEVTNVGYDDTETGGKLYGVDTDGSYDNVRIGGVEMFNIPGGESAGPETFERNLEEGDHQIDELRFDLDSEQFTESINVTEAEIAITEFETNEPIEGEDLVVEAEFERFGELDLGYREATFSVDGEEQESTALNLVPTETTSEEFVYETSSDDGSALDIEVEVPGDSNVERTDVPLVSQEEHNESMSANITNEPAANLSEELEVETEIDYHGDVPDGETVVPTTFLVDGSVANETNVTVEDGAPTDVTFATELDEDTVPVTSVTVETPGRSDTVEFARAVTTDVSVNDPFASNESLEAIVEIENDGDTPEVVNVTVSVDDPASVKSDGSESRELSVNASETIEAEFTFEPTDHASSQIEVTAETDDSSETATTNRPMFKIETVELEGADDAGSGLTMSGNVTNTGEIPDTQTIQFTLDGELVTEKNVTLDPDESETVSADIDPPEEDGEYGFGMTANNETATAGESAEGSAEINVSGTSLLDRLSSLALPLLLLGLLVIGVIALKYRDDPQAFKRRIATAKSTVQSTVQGVVGGGGSVIVENGLPRDSTVRIQVKDANGVVFQEDLQLADGEQREFPSLPDGGQFEVGVGVDDVASHSEVFQGPIDSVGVVLQPDGITIAEL
ncbi:hypothetical protein [Halostagnicola sp. A-GB9-2]|uniref:hypothetical protein n=1 Tax=Halostagnicola sp. A-GB9-2 TaxID=3048066 RepID=UPI0024C0C584|nr:hypothetical protein [Halostagnicola sp. A-GB9-2]MDJ1432145.1 hypothetical protein [Halostagnicola sp. A-GB9-2]